MSATRVALAVPRLTSYMRTCVRVRVYVRMYVLHVQTGTRGRTLSPGVLLPASRIVLRYLYVRIVLAVSAASSYDKIRKVKRKRERRTLTLWSDEASWIRSSSLEQTRKVPLVPRCISFPNTFPFYRQILRVISYGCPLSQRETQIVSYKSLKANFFLVTKLLNW